MTIELQKKRLRSVCSKKREELNEKNSNFSYKLAEKINEIKELDKAKFIASFISIKTEISTEYLNDYLLDIGKKICLPVILNNEFLIFRAYDDNTILEQGKYKILEPNYKSKEIIPELILTPCLAFDNLGYRLGYGGGYYDKTFSRYRKLEHTFTSIAVAYDDQRIDKVIIDKNDEKIDYILTEKNLYKS